MPIPGIGYVFQKDRRYRVAVGGPFLLAEFRPWRGLGLECAYFPVRTVHGGINDELDAFGSTSIFRERRSGAGRRIVSRQPGQNFPCFS